LKLEIRNWGDLSACGHAQAGMKRSVNAYNAILYVLFFISFIRKLIKQNKYPVNPACLEGKSCLKIKNIVNSESSKEGIQQGQS